MQKDNGRWITESPLDFIGFEILAIAWGGGEADDDNPFCCTLRRSGSDRQRIIYSNPIHMPVQIYAYNLLTEHGFVFLDGNGEAFWLRMWHGKPWLFAWQGDHFEQVKPMPSEELAAVPQNMPIEEQKKFIRRHAAWLATYDD